MSETAIEAPSEPSSIRRTEGRFAPCAERTLFRRSWLPAEPRRSVVLVHGFGEHSGRYEDFGAWFAARGMAVHAYDHMGHGRSDGKRGHARRFDDFLDDLAAFLATVQSEHPGIPCALVGHSMGGLIAAAMACEQAPEVDHVITSGPLLAMEAGPSGLKLAIARALGLLWPRFTSDAGIPLEALSRDPKVCRRYQEDPLVHSDVTASLGVALNQGAQRTLRAGASLGIPILMLHGGADALCAPSGSETFFAGVTVKGSALRIYPELRHEIFNEPEGEAIFQDILRWLNEGRAPSGSGSVVSE